MKLCPVMKDGEDNATCVRGRCMWWRNEDCAIVGLYGALVQLAGGQSLDPDMDDLLFELQAREKERRKDFGLEPDGGE